LTDAECRSPGRFCRASPGNSIQDRVARGIHHFITSSGQKANGNLGGGSSAMVGGTGRAATGFPALAAMCLRLFGAFRPVDAAFVFFFL
jgi:hypothetical protein